MDSTVSRIACSITGILCLLLNAACIEKPSDSEQNTDINWTTPPSARPHPMYADTMVLRYGTAEGGLVYYKDGVVSSANPKVLGIILTLESLRTDFPEPNEDLEQAWIQALGGGQSYNNSIDIFYIPDFLVDVDIHASKDVFGISAGESLISLFECVPVYNLYYPESNYVILSSGESLRLSKTPLTDLVSQKPFVPRILGIETTSAVTIISDVEITFKYTMSSGKTLFASKSLSAL